MKNYKYLLGALIVLFVFMCIKKYYDFARAKSTIASTPAAQQQVVENARRTGRTYESELNSAAIRLSNAKNF